MDKEKMIWVNTPLKLKKQTEHPTSCFGKNRLSKHQVFTKCSFTRNYQVKLKCMREWKCYYWTVTNNAEQEKTKLWENFLPTNNFNFEVKLKRKQKMKNNLV